MSPQTLSSNHTRAIHLKEQGNDYFNKKSYNEAASFYSKAIAVFPQDVSFWTNRANAYFHQQKWNQVISDSREAIKLDESYVKGHYFLGRSLVEIGEFDDGIQSLTKALSLSSSNQPPGSTKTRLITEIEIALDDARKRRWEKDYSLEVEKYVEAQRIVDAALDNQLIYGRVTTEEYGDTKEIVSNLFKTVISTNRVVPEHFCCAILMSLMREPVILPSGVSVERDTLLTHFEANGYIDPFSRKPCNPKDMIPNLGLKHAIDAFVAENPWAVEEYTKKL